MHKESLTFDAFGSISTDVLSKELKIDHKSQASGVSID